MSVRIDRWFGMPPELFDAGHIAHMSHSSLRLCAFLYWKSDKQSSRELKVRDKEIIQHAGFIGPIPFECEERASEGRLPRTQTRDRWWVYLHHL